MAAVIRSGAFDLIGAARPAIADPFLPRKIAEGRLGDIRECTGANVCIMKEEAFGHVGCIQNATAGEEFRRGWHPERFEPTPDPDRAVLVVGAGPAGMECAMVLGRRGFAAVHLVDAEDEVGGRIRWTRRLPTLGDWGRVADWRRTQLDQLPNVEVITGRRLSAADVLDYGAGIVIVATGSRWSGDGSQPGRLRPISLAPGLPEALTPERVMTGDRPTGQRVAVYDVDGYYVGPGIAELLAAEGYDVHLVTPRAGRLADLGRHARGAACCASTCTTSGSRCTSASRCWRTSRVASAARRSTATRGCSSVDDLVLVTHQVPSDELHRALVADPTALDAAGITAVHLIGDAASPRWISESVFDGHRLAREIDLPDPSFPAAVRRDEPA